MFNCLIVSALIASCLRVGTLLSCRGKKPLQYSFIIIINISAIALLFYWCYCDSIVGKTSYTYRRLGLARSRFRCQHSTPLQTCRPANCKIIEDIVRLRNYNRGLHSSALSRHIPIAWAYHRPGTYLNYLWRRSRTCRWIVESPLRQWRSSFARGGQSVAWASLGIKLKGNLNTSQLHIRWWWQSVHSPVAPG